MVNEDQEIVREFLAESAENLARLDQEMVELEANPNRQDLLASIFRTVHNIKGTCGFLGFGRLEAVAHATEDILNDLRQGRRRLNGHLTTLILGAVDTIKRLLASIESRSTEGDVFESDLLARLEVARAADQPNPETDAAPPVSDREPDAGATAQTASVTETSLRVDVGLLDRLMNLVGELVLTRNQLLQFHSGHEDPTLSAISQRLNLITSELQEGVMKTRMQPIGLVWNKLPRIVRDLATTLDKEIELEMEGAGTELDRAIIEAIKDPLTHIVRNSCDHGIDSRPLRLERGKPPRGRITLRAYHEGGQVNIEIADDGSGIDPVRVKSKAVERGLITSDQSARMSDREAINLVFVPGFSTAAQVTNVSGRGVGMDVVKTNIERIGGAVELLSDPGRGTTVRVRIPLTLAIIPGLVVCAGDERFVIPQANLHELVRLEGEAIKQLERVHRTPVLRRRNALLPVADLSDVLGIQPKRSADEINIVILQAEGERFGLIVDGIGDSQEIVVKPLGQQLKSLNFYAGATIMGDGRIALILDVMGLRQRAGLLAPAVEASRRSSSLSAEATSSTAPGEARSAILLFRAGCFARLAMPLSQVARLEKIPAGTTELAGGRLAVQYRGRLLLLLDVAEMLGSSRTEAGDLDVVVYRNGDSEVGLLVDEILDIVTETVVNPHPADRPGLLGSAVMKGRVTDFLDLAPADRWHATADSGGLERLRQMLTAQSVMEVGA